MSQTDELFLQGNPGEVEARIWGDVCRGPKTPSVSDSGYASIASTEVTSIQVDRETPRDQVDSQGEPQRTGHPTTDVIPEAQPLADKNIASRATSFASIFGDFRPFPHDGSFNQRYNDIVRQTNQPLMEHLRKEKVLEQGRMIGQRLIILGKTEEDAMPTIVFFCTENQGHKILQFFGKGSAKKLCRPDDPNVVTFDIKITSSLRPRVQMDTVEVLLAGMDYTSIRSGSSIWFHDKSSGEKRQATTGGILKILFNDGRLAYFGMTTAHSIAGWDMLSDSGTHHDCHEPTKPDHPRSDCDGNTDNITAQKPELKAARSDGLKPIAKWVTTSQFDTKYLDWSVFELDNWRPDLYSGPCLLMPLKPLLMLSSTVGVYIPTRNGAQITGTLTSEQTYVAIYPGQQFVKAYLVEVEEGGTLKAHDTLRFPCTRLILLEILDGDSGAWVIDRNTNEVYGHVIATDPFGDAYIIPFFELMEDMKKQLNAQQITFPFSDLEDPGIWDNVQAYISRQLQLKAESVTDSGYESYRQGFPSYPPSFTTLSRPASVFQDPPYPGTRPLTSSGSSHSHLSGLGPASSPGSLPILTIPDPEHGILSSPLNSAHNVVQGNDPIALSPTLPVGRPQHNPRGSNTTLAKVDGVESLRERVEYALPKVTVDQVISWKEDKKKWYNLFAGTRTSDLPGLSEALMGLTGRDQVYLSTVLKACLLLANIPIDILD
jgi:hypothetical protein